MLGIYHLSCGNKNADSCAFLFYPIPGPAIQSPINLAGNSRFTAHDSTSGSLSFNHPEKIDCRASWKVIFSHGEKSGRSWGRFKEALQMSIPIIRLII